jgi:hypothetical protein
MPIWQNVFLIFFFFYWNETTRYKINWRPVDEFAADAPLEKSAAPVARQYPVVLSARCVTAHDARQPQCLGLDRDLAAGRCSRSVMSGGRSDRSRWRSGRGHRYLLCGTRGRHAQRKRPVSHGIVRIRVCNKRPMIIILIVKLRNNNNHNIVPAVDRSLWAVTWRRVDYGLPGFQTVYEYHYRSCPTVLESRS